MGYDERCEKRVGTGIQWVLRAPWCCSMPNATMTVNGKKVQCKISVYFFSSFFYETKDSLQQHSCFLNSIELTENESPKKINCAIMDARTGEKTMCWKPWTPETPHRCKTSGKRTVAKFKRILKPACLLSATSATAILNVVRTILPTSGFVNRKRRFPIGLLHHSKRSRWDFLTFQPHFGCY